MIGASNTPGQKYCVGIVQLVPETSVSEEIVDIFHNYNMIIHVISLPTMGFWLPMKGIWYEWNAGILVALVIFSYIFGGSMWKHY